MKPIVLATSSGYFEDSMIESRIFCSLDQIEDVNANHITCLLEDSR